MRWPRRFVSAWWLTLIVVSCLFARPMHEWLDAVQARATVNANLQASASQAGQAPGAQAAQDQDHPDDGSQEEGAQTPTCAWCAVLGQAQAPAAVPVMLVAHAEASPPPVLLEQGRPTGRCALAAEPRGPPRA